jgi:parallel beta-helix repeat protein
MSCIGFLVLLASCFEQLVIRKMKKTILLLLLFTLVVFQSQNQSAPHEPEQTLGTPVVSLVGSSVIYPLGGGEYEKQSVSSNSDFTRESIQIIQGISDYFERGPITILNDTAFGPLGYNFPGSGSSSDPFRIEGYNITDSIMNLIHIENTTKYFSINNSIFDCQGSSFYGIYLSNSMYGTIENNIIRNSNSYGIHLSLSNNTTLSNNTIYDCSGGVGFSFSNFNMFLNNTISDIDAGSSVYLSDSSNNTFTNNTIYNNVVTDGLSISDSNNNSFSTNTIHTCAGDGISLGWAEYNKFEGNGIYNCGGGGISLEDAHYNSFTVNTINQCDNGFWLDSSSSNNTLLGNLINNLLFDGIRLWDSNNNNTIASNVIYTCGRGVYLSSSDNNTIWNNTIYDCGYTGAIIISNSFHNEVFNNTLSYAFMGIILEFSSRYNLLSDNTIFNITDIAGIGSGIYVDSSHNNTLSRNTIYGYNAMEHYGIEVDSGTNNTIIDNTIFGCYYGGIYLGSTSTHNTLSANTIHHCDYAGISIITSSFNLITGNYIFDLGSRTGIGVWGSSDNNTLDSNQVSNCSNGISVQFSYNTTIVKNSISDCSANGISLGTSSTNVLSGNFISNCSQYSIFLDSSCNSNTLTYNTVYNGEDDGIHLYSASNNTISYNIVYNHTNYGLYITGSSSYNIVTWNNFVNNSVGFTSQALDVAFSTNNISFNYWSDWSGTGNYSIDELPNGGANNEDPSPLVNPVLPTVTILTPIAQEYETEKIIVLLTGTPTVFHYQYYIAGIDGANQTWTTSVDRLLPDGSYTLYAYGSDILGNTVHDSETFTIDVYLPTVVITSPTTTVYTHTNVPLIYTVSYGAATLYLNGMANSTAIPSGSVVSDFPDAPAIPDGSYNITIVAVDQAGNVAKETVLFTIDTTPPTVEIDSPTATTYATGTIKVTLSGDADHYWFYIAGIDGANQTWTAEVTLGLADGTYTLHAFGNDSVGNVAHTSVTFEIETPITTTPTTPTTTAPTTTPLFTTTPEVTIPTMTTTTTEAASGSFPGVFTVLLFVTTLVVILRRHKNP